ncbi:MAG: proline racemase family protein [Gemmataceae bacterium]
MHSVHVVDSHTAGEPTRVVVAGGPDLGGGSVAERLAVFRDRHDAFRSAIVNEPRGSDVLVGALVCEPSDPSCTAGVIFFNNVGYLGMCGHGTIGLIVTLAATRQLRTGRFRIETPVGVVTTELHADASVSVENVPSYRKAAGVRVAVPGLGEVVGDVAYGGNWFFLADAGGEALTVANAERLTDIAWRIRQAVNVEFPEVDHVELFGPDPGGADARNFVLCPGKAYDRSPCGTGTSAKLACLAADGKLADGVDWVQAGVLGTRFTGRYRSDGEHIVPTITGAAYITAMGSLILDDRDPFAWGIR